MGKKGKQSAAGQPENPWGEIKTERLETKLTLTGKKLLLEFSKESGLTISEILELVARRKFSQPDRRLADFLERCERGESVPHLEIIELGHDLDIDSALLWKIYECLTDRSKENAAN